MEWNTPNVLTGVLVVITGVYAALTYGILAATRRSVETVRQQTEAMSRPYVTVSPFVLPKNAILFLRVSNIGKTAAEHLRLKLERPFYRFGKAEESENLASFAAFQNEIPSFAPGVELRFSLAMAPILFGDKADEVKTPKVFRITATYSFAGTTVTEPTDVDLRPFAGTHMAFDPVVDELSEIKDALKKPVGDGLRGIADALKKDA